ncbi:uncharacterized protein LOC128204833 [Mya arenaria]|uniref:uncharacterized protein LOC128204833 n=1 Tax=Mya arenaria TaxID=6604 RepID=UPI0022E62C0E|nr:uncharacterized protein LOC128204833 [Mya arenaria]
MPPDGYETISSSDETDLDGFVSVLTNFFLFENYIPDLANTANVATKVREIGRKVRHASKLEVTDDELKQWFGDMKALFNVPQHLAANSYAQSTLDVLNKLELDQLHIERTDVLDAIIDVVTSLKRLNSSVDAENIIKLQEIQQDIETQVEVHKRNVGDLVDEKKVEVTQHASTLQPIIDNNVDAGQQSFNEFKKELKKILLKHHSTNTSTLSLGPFFPNGESSIEDFYVPPTLSEVFTQTTCDNKKLLETKKQPITSLEPLLTMNDTLKQFTIITANAGVGKTSFCNFLAVLWCASQTNERDVFKHLGKRYNLSFDVLEDIKYLFYIDMTTIPSEVRNSVEEILYIHLKDELGYSEDDKQLFEKLCTQDRGLVILDGLDESAISKLQPQIANRTYSVVLTCRPWKLADMDIPRHTYLHLSVNVLDAESVEELLRHANTCLNSHYGTTFKVEDFLAAVKSQNLQSFTSNALMGLQLYCVWHGRCIDDETTQKSNIKLTLGKTRSLIYADVLEMMFDIGKKRYKESLPRAQLQAPNERRLPPCFERCNTCKANSDTIYETGKIAFQMLIDLKWCFDQETMPLLKENKLLQASGLITAIKSHKCSIKNTMYRFLHKTYQEFFAAVYLSSLKFESEDWMAYESHFESTFTPEIMLFLCVMNYEQGQRCAEMFGDIDRTFYRKSTFYFEKLIEYQSTVLQSYNECVNNGVFEPKLALRHSYIDNELMSDDHYLLNFNAKTTETYAVKRYGVCATNMNSKETMEERNITSLKTYYSNLQVFPKTSLTTLELIWLDNFEIHERNNPINFVHCENLKVLILQNIRLRRVAIAPAQLEQLVVSTREDLWKKIPPMEVTFAHGEQFSNRLRELSLVHIFLNGRLDISQCDKLQKLELDTMSFRATYHLDVSSFTDLTQITLKDIRLWQLTIGPAQLELFCVSTSENMWDTIPAMELSFQHREQFSSKLRELWLDNISLDRQLDISQCAKLQTLKLDTLSFPDDYHLDISSFTDLTRITLNDISLMQLTIAPAQLELFCVSTSEYMLDTIPAIEVSFQDGEQFSSKLRELSLDNITLNGPLDISQCDKLQTLWLNTLSFPEDYHLNVSSFTDITKITLRNVRLQHVTIAPAQLEQFWVLTKKEHRDKIPPMEVTFAYGEQFSNKLVELRLGNIIVNGRLNISRCNKLRKLRLDRVAFPDDYHLDMSSFTDLTRVTLQNVSLKHVTIAPGQLEVFCVLTRDELLGRIPPMNMTFAHGEQYTNKLRNLGLNNIILNSHLDKNQFDRLQTLCLITLSFPDDYHLDVSSFTDLTEIILRNICLKQMTIAPAQLETFSVVTDEDLREKIPPIEMTFAHGEQYTNKLKELSMDNIVLNGYLDISQCDKLQELRLYDVSFPGEYHLDISSFTDLTRIKLRNVRLWHITIAPAQLKQFCVYTNTNLLDKIPAMKVTFDDGVQFTNKLLELGLGNIVLNGQLDISQCDQLQTLQLVTISFPDDYHLDVSSFTDLTEIILRNICLKQMTIAPAQLETFWVVTDEDLREKIPPIEVTFAHGEQYTNKLKELSMDNILLNGYLDISQCDKLQKLRLYYVSFPDEYHLDISSFTDLTRIKLRNIRLYHITIAPAQLERFWVYTNTNLLDKIPAMRVTFEKGEQFTNKLLELSLCNIVLNGLLDISQCDKLQRLVLNALSFPDDYHLDVSSYTDLTDIELLDIRLKHLTIAPLKLECCLVFTSEDLREKIPPMEVTLAHGKQYSNTLLELFLGNIILNDRLDISSYDKLHTLQLESLSFPDDYHLDLSSYTDLTEIALLDIRLKKLTIAPFKLELFGVSTSEDLWDEISPMEVALAQGEQYSNTLLELILDNIILDGSLDISQCNKLQNLKLDKLSFPDEYHLDMSSFTDLTKITLQNIRIQHLTIDPSKLEQFSVSTSEDLLETIPPIKVTFAQEERFSNKLRELILDNIVLNGNLDISQSCKLKTLRLATLTFPEDYHLDLTSYADLTVISFRNVHLRHVTISPAKFEIFRALNVEHMRGNIQPMEVTILGGAKFTHKLKKLGLVNIILDEPIDLSQCSNITEIKLSEAILSDAKGVPEVMQRMKMYRSEGCVIYEQVHSKQI